MNIFSKLLLFIAIAIFLPFNQFAQTTLNSGELIIINVNADSPDNFDFVPLVDLASGTIIHFTDKPWDLSAAPAAFVGSEGIRTYTASSIITAGTVVSHSGTVGGDWTSSGSYDIAIAGDNLLVYQGSETSPTFIYGIGWGKTDNWTYNSSSPNHTRTSDIPTTLSKTAYTISQLGTDDNYRYLTSIGTNTSAATWLIMMSDETYWESDDITAYSALTGSLGIGTPEILMLEVTSNSTAGENYIEIYNNSSTYFELINNWKINERPNANNLNEFSIVISGSTQINTGGSKYLILDPDEYAIILEDPDPAKVTNFKSTHGIGVDEAIFSQASNSIPTINGFERFQLVDNKDVEIDQLPVWDWDGKDYVHKDSCYVRTDFYKSANKGNANGHDHAPGWLRHHQDTYNYTPAALNSDGDGGTYPVDLISFEIKSVNENNSLEWVTASELNTAYFIVEKSINAVDFIEVGTAKASGNSNIIKYYKFVDFAIDNNTQLYYRLKMVDFDASFEYSKTISIGSNHKSNFKAYPNPANTYLSFEGIDASTDKYMVYNTSGQLVLQGNFSKSTIINLEQLSQGFYLVKVIRNNVDYKNINLIVNP